MGGMLRRLYGVLLAGLLAGCYSTGHETRPFFQEEYQVEAHGRKTVFDHVVEVDPGGFDVDVAPNAAANPSQRIAVLPFTDVGSANLWLIKSR
jgi:hypothetical protein